MLTFIVRRALWTVLVMFAITVLVFPPQQRGFGLALIAVVALVSSALGPVLGGVLGGPPPCRFRTPASIKVAWPLAAGPYIPAPGRGVVPQTAGVGGVRCSPRALQLLACEVSARRMRTVCTSRIGGLYGP